MGAVGGSAALCDLDHSGHPQIVLPVSAQVPEPGYMTVLDAATGATRWQTAPGPTFITSPFCVDVNGDGTDDVLVGQTVGNDIHVTASDLLAFSGKDGSLLWSFDKVNPGTPFLGNVYPVVAQVPEPSVMFVSFGGDQLDNLMYPTIPRVPGGVLAIDRTSKIVARWDEPDKAEVYSTPAILRDASGELLLAVGSGGETNPGKLYLLHYDETAHSFSVKFAVPSSCATGGYIASPMFGDVNGDGLPEIAAADYCGTTVAVRLADGSTLWQVTTTPPFALANPVLADVTGDGALDVIVAFSTFDPAHELATLDTATSEVVAMDGRNGNQLWTQHVAAPVTAAPVSADVNGDGLEDMLILGWRIPTWRPKTPADLMGVPGKGTKQWLSGVDGSVLQQETTGNSWGTPLISNFSGNGAIDTFFTNADLQTGDSPAIATEYPGTTFSASASYSGFRGSSFDGYRR
jgi:hypothetical protein